MIVSRSQVQNTTPNRAAFMLSIMRINLLGVHGIVLVTTQKVTHTIIDSLHEKTIIGTDLGDRKYLSISWTHSYTRIRINQSGFDCSGKEFIEILVRFVRFNHILGDDSIMLSECRVYGFSI